MKYLEMNQIQSAVYSLGLDNKTSELILAELGKTPAANIRHNVQAKWKTYPCIWECSNCGHWIFREHGNIILPDSDLRYWKFCPSCGAQMEVRNEKS